MITVVHLAQREPPGSFDFVHPDITCRKILDRENAHTGEWCKCFFSTKGAALGVAVAVPAAAAIAASGAAIAAAATASQAYSLLSGAAYASSGTAWGWISGNTALYSAGASYWGGAAAAASATATAGTTATAVGTISASIAAAVAVPKWYDCCGCRDERRMTCCSCGKNHHRHHAECKQQDMCNLVVQVQGVTLPAALRRDAYFTGGRCIDPSQDTGKFAFVDRVCKDFAAQKPAGQLQHRLWKAASDENGNTSWQPVIEQKNGQLFYDGQFQITKIVGLSAMGSRQIEGLSIEELRKHLDEVGVVHDGCIEKQEFVQLLKGQMQQPHLQQPAAQM